MAFLDRPNAGLQDYVTSMLDYLLYSQFFFNDWYFLLLDGMPNAFKLKASVVEFFDEIG